MCKWIIDINFFYSYLIEISETIYLGAKNELMHEKDLALNNI